MKVLILYATRRGSTAEVAQYIEKILSEYPVEISLANAAEFEGDLAEYDAYILGTNIYNGMWNHILTEKIRLSLASIGKKPVWGWAMCIRVIEENAEPYLRRDYMPGTLVPKLNLRGFKFFAGKLLYEDINLDERWTLAVRYDGMHDPNDFNGDFRNWDTISEWAHKIGAEITQFS